MSDINLALEGIEAEVTAAALAHYAGFLSRCRALGGDAADIDEAIRPVVARVAVRLADAMYPDGAPEPWAPPDEQQDPITAAKAVEDRHADCDCHYINREAALRDADLALGDHYAGMPA